VLFQPDAFADAPIWSPGEGFVPAIDNYSWYRRDDDGLVTAVVTEVFAGPPSGDEEVTTETWAVVLDTKNDGGESLFYELWNKPRRVRYLLDYPDSGYGRSRIVSRKPLTKDHFSNRVSEYWEVFQSKNGFVPNWAFWKGVMPRPWITFDWSDSGHYYSLEDLDRILDAVAILEARWPIKVRVYPGQYTELRGNDYAWSIAPRRSR
jgi:hypothetical protein